MPPLRHPYQNVKKKAAPPCERAHRATISEFTTFLELPPSGLTLHLAHTTEAASIPAILLQNAPSVNFKKDVALIV
jgi:hypothetical protein